MHLNPISDREQHAAAERLRHREGECYICHVCGSHFADDGSRVLTRTPHCAECPLPPHLRKVRDLMLIGRIAVLGHGTDSEPEYICVIERLGRELEGPAEGRILARALLAAVQNLERRVANLEARSR